MEQQPTAAQPKINPITDAEFDHTSPAAWSRYVADSLVLTGLKRRSGRTYAREVGLLVQRFGKSPVELTEADVRTFMLERYDKLNGSSQRILYRGLTFLFRNLLGRDWALLDAVKSSPVRQEPPILSRAEVGRLFACIKAPHTYTYLRTVYSCGLRLNEALQLRPGDIDRDHGLVHVRNGKGGKHRKVFLPSFTLQVLRRYWLRHQNPDWLFPALGRGGKDGATATRPMSIPSVQQGLQRHLKRAGITKSKVTIHTLRHSYATHMLEAGMPLTVLQQQLGHANLQTTLIYVHLSQPAQVDSARLVEKLMRRIP